MKTIAVQKGNNWLCEEHHTKIDITKPRRDWCKACKEVKKILRQVNKLLT